MWGNGYSEGMLTRDVTREKWRIVYSERKRCLVGKSGEITSQGT